MAITNEAEQEYAHLNSLLNPLDIVKATDPGLVTIAETDVRVPNSHPTSDPHRVTFVVPTPEDVVFSLGAAGPAERIADVGITGRTKHHVHFVTTTDEKEVKEDKKKGGGAPASAGASQTLVTLGGPALTATTQSHGGQVATTSRGFAMLTDGRSWLDAKEQFVAISREDNIIIRAASKEGKYAVLQSDVGSVEVNGKKAVSIASSKSVVISSDKDLETVDHAYGEKKYEPTSSNLVANKVVKALLASSDTFISFLALYKATKKVGKAAKAGFSTWTPQQNLDAVKLLVDAAKFVSSTGRELYAWAGYIDSVKNAKPEVSSLEKVAIQTSGAASITGELSASMYGGLSASISSPISASVLGGTASLRGLAWASIWGGFEASMKGLKDATVEAERGKVTVKSVKEASLTSSGSTVVVQGKDNVQLNSTDGDAYVYGANKTYIGSGTTAGSGAGVIVEGSKQSITLGPVPLAAGVFKTARVDPTNKLTIEPNKIEGTVRGTKLQLRTSSACLKVGAEGFVVALGVVKVYSSGRVLLG